MTNFYSVEAQIKSDWSLMRAFMALHPIWSTLGLLLVGGLIGHWL